MPWHECMRPSVASGQQPPAPGQGSGRVEVDKGYRRTDTKTPAPCHPCRYPLGEPASQLGVSLLPHSQPTRADTHLLTAWKLRAGLPRPSGQPNFLSVRAGLSEASG